MYQALIVNSHNRNDKDTILYCKIMLNCLKIGHSILAGHQAIHLQLSAVPWSREKRKKNSTCALRFLGMNIISLIIWMDSCWLHWPVKPNSPFSNFYCLALLKKKEKRFQKARIHFHLASIYKWSCSFYKPVKMEGEW